VKLTKTVYSLTMLRTKKVIIQKYGNVFWNEFKIRSKEHVTEILPQVTDIGSSIFAFNYEFCTAYIAWYKAFMELGLSSNEACIEIWMMNEKLVTIIPKWLVYMSVKAYIGGFRKKAVQHVQKQEAGNLHPYDWKLGYHEISDNTFELDITECGMLKLSQDFDAMGMYPMICRMDYLFSHYMGNGFERTKTLGDGDDCCSCRYSIIGSCEWSPEKGFENRK
jgi:hypothetical protein